MKSAQRRIRSKELLTDFVGGDVAAFDAFYQLHYTRLFRFGLTVAANREEVRDQLQDVFVWVYENAGKLVVKDDPETYLLAALRNRIRKSLGRRRLTPSSAEELEALTTPDQNFIDKLCAMQDDYRRAELLAREIAKLPDRQRQVLYLRFYENKPYEEIAAIMNTNVAVTRNFVYRGLQKLRASPQDLKQALFLLQALGLCA